MTTTPPHLAHPRIEHVDATELTEFLSVVMRGFHDQYHGDELDLDQRLFTPERTFGHRVDDRWVSTFGAFARQLTLPGGAAVDIAAVTIVSVAPSYRRRGLLRELMTHQLQLTHDTGEPMALLWASEAVIYGRFGFGLAVAKAAQSGQTGSLTFLTDVDLGGGSVAEVGRAEFEAVAAGLHLALLPERPGALDRMGPWWEATLLDPERDRDGYAAVRFLLGYDVDGRPNGYARFRVKRTWGGPDSVSNVEVQEVDALDPAAYARLWRFLADLDLVRTFTRPHAPVDDPLLHLLADPRALQQRVGDATHLRLVDVARSLETRAYGVEVDLVLEVSDPLLPHNHGRWHLQAGPDGASVRKARRRPDLTLGVKDLATVFMGGVSPTTLAAAGRIVEHRAGAVERASRAFGWTRAPFTPDQF